MITSWVISRPADGASAEKTAKMMMAAIRCNTVFKFNPDSTFGASACLHIGGEGELNWSRSRRK